MLAHKLTAGESLFDDDEVAAWKEKQEQQGSEEMPAGESLFDDDEVEAWKNRQSESESEPEEAAENEVSFDSKENSLTADIVFDERGNVKEGGNPDIAYYHVTEFNGERIDEPTHGAEKLMEAIEKGEAYEVKLAPPSFNQFQCTEKVEGIHVVLERFSHELPEALLERAANILADEGVTNTKQLGELDLKDYDEIRLPALIKTRLRKVREEARAQSDVAAGKVEMDSKEVEDELREFMAAREQVEGAPEANNTKEQASEQQPAVAEQQPVGDMEEEDGTFKSLVWAVLNCPTCKGKETIACFRSCRYNVVLGEEGKKRSWSECLDQCIENRWLRATFRAMLPSTS